MEKLKSKVQIAKDKRNLEIKKEYDKRKANGEGSWVIVDHLASKYCVSNNTIYRIIK